MVAVISMQCLNVEATQVSLLSAWHRLGSSYNADQSSVYTLVFQPSPIHLHADKRDTRLNPAYFGTPSGPRFNCRRSRTVPANASCLKQPTRCRFSTGSATNALRWIDNEKPSIAKSMEFSKASEHFRRSQNQQPSFELRRLVEVPHLRANFVPVARQQRTREREEGDARYVKSCSDSNRRCNPSCFACSPLA